VSAQPGPAPKEADRSARAVRWASAGAVLAGLISLAAPFVPWWYTTTNTGTLSTAEFYPLGGLYASGGGGGGFTSFASEGLGSVGFLALSAGGLGIARTTGHAASRRARLVARSVLVVALVASVAAVVAVPLVQPSLFANADPHGTCSTPSSAGSCTSFWGTYHATGVTTVWGAGAGWWSEAVAAVLLAAAWLGGAGASVKPPPGG